MIVDTIKDPILRAAVRDAFADSMRGMWILLTALSGVAVVVCVFIRKGELSEVHVETQTGLREKEKSDTDEAQSG